MKKQTYVGFIGLGAMGAPMARRLLDAGHKLVVNDVNEEAMDKLVEVGAQRAGSAREVASLAEIVFVSLPTPAVVESIAHEVLQGEAVRLYIDLSTTGPTVAKRVAQALAAKGIASLDAPISGGVMGASNGTLCIMTSGPREAFERARPLLDRLAKSLFHAGLEIGQGQALKLANNILGASALIAAVEGLAMCVRMGIDPNQAMEVFNASTGRSLATEMLVPRAVISGAYNFGFRLELMHKDVRLCLQESEALGVPMWQGAATGQMWNFAMTQGMGKEDFSAIAKLVAQWAKVDLTAPPKS